MVVPDVPRTHRGEAVVTEAAAARAALGAHRGTVRPFQRRTIDGLIVDPNEELLVDAFGHRYIRRNGVAHYIDGEKPVNGHEATVADDDDDEDDREETLADVLLSRLLTVEQLLERPPPEPLVDGVLFRNTIVAVYGPRGGGKSFVVQDLALCKTTGTWWHGHRLEPGPVLYVAAEGSPGLGQRFASWLGAHKLHDAGPLHIYPGAINVFRADEAHALAEVAFMCDAELVIIDTLARSIVGAEENSAKDMGVVVANAEAIRRASGACVLVVHHTRQDGQVMRGSTALDGAADTLIECKANGERVTLRCEKQKDAAEFEPVTLHRAPFAGSCVLRSNVAATIDELPESRATILELFRATFGATGATKAELRDAVVEAHGVERSTAYRGINDLVTLGLLVNEGSKTRPFLVLPDPENVAMSQPVACDEPQSSHAPSLLGGCDVRHDAEVEP